MGWLADLSGAWPWRQRQTGKRDYPIAILSFDRPHYLRPVLESLKGQVCTADDIILFQDGSRNPFSRREKARQSDIDACVGLFRNLFPNGEVLTSPVNLGIAFNYERAETHVFENRQAEKALFLEDDMVLSRNYLDVIDQLLGFAANNPRLAYVSAYGDLWASRKLQRHRLRELQPMHENWGAALTRRSWLAERQFRLQYLNLLRDCDYSHRDHRAIAHFFQSRGWTTQVSSQDCARWIAAVERGAVRLTTCACHAKYIGVEGEHFNRAIYERARFAQSQMHNGSIAALIPPTDLQIDKWLALARRQFQGSSTEMYPGHAQV